MKKFLSGMMASAIAASFALAGALPVNAAPITYVPQSAQSQTDVQTVQFKRDWRHKQRVDRRINRKVDRRVDRRMDRREARFHARNGIGYYNGHRGYRNYRKGYREYNGWWFPAGAFIAGALITGAVTADRNVSSGSAHVDWCANRYRSYRAYDNTYQPYNGPRQQCVSPY